MITTVKRKTIVSKIDVTKMERFVSFEIKLPANVTKVTGLLVTASRK